MLLIAIGFGAETDPFTCSTTAPNDLDHTDANACRDFICKDKDLEPQWVDEVLVILPTEGYGDEPEVAHQHHEFDDTDDDEDEDEDDN